MSWILESLSFLHLDRKQVETYVLVGLALVAAYLGWKYVSAQSAASQAAANATNQQTAQATAVQNELQSQLEQGQLSQSLASLYPNTAGTVTGGTSGIGTVAQVSLAPVSQNSTGTTGNFFYSGPSPGQYTVPQLLTPSHSGPSGGGVGTNSVARAFGSPVPADTSGTSANPYTTGIPGPNGLIAV